MIDFNAENKIFHLETKNTSYVLGAFKSGLLMHLYWGKKLSQTNDWEQ